MVFSESFSNLVVTCAARISPFLSKEISALGYENHEVFKTGVKLKGSLRDCIRLNIHLRTASQVHYSIKKFGAANATDLYNQAKAIPWEDYIKPGGYFSITSNVKNDTIDNPLYANVKVKDAIADRFRDRSGQRPDSGPELDRVVIYLYWHNEEAEIFLDTSGETLSKHGYRKIPGKAPMMESLAAATILAGSWNKQSNFLNPMCGSGTIAIEAALMASGRVPGLLRENYSFMHLAGYDESIYQDELDDARQNRVPVKGFKIIASDISEDAIKIAKINAGIAGVDHLIDFVQCDFTETPVPEGGGAIYFNPEYGDRMGEELALVETYSQIGDFLKKRAGGYYGYVFTGNLELAKRVGLKPKKRIEFFNGKIDCRLFEYELWAGSR